MESKQKICIPLIVLLIIGIIVSYSIGFNSGLKQGEQKIEEKYQTKIEEIFPSEIEPEEIFSIWGEIQEVKENGLIVKAIFRSANPFEEEKTELKTVNFAENTLIVKQVEKSPQEMTTEEKAFEKAIRENPDSNIFPPEFFNEVSISFSDLKIGNNIGVESEENIKGKTEFTANKIILESF